MVLAEPDIRWDLSFGAGNDPLDGLDRFGRVVDNRWYNYGTSADACRVQYGYDRAGSRTYREQTVDFNSYFDEVYRYDGSDRLTGMDRGPLAAPKTSVSPLKFAQCWGIDATGNWRDFREDNDGTGGWNLVQSRTHNGVNEISDISETSGPAWITPLYDRAGNMTRVPKPNDPTQYYSCTYDAWNRLVKLQDGANTVAEYKYDGAKRRIIKKTYTGGSLTETRHLYFTNPSKWQVIEERTGSSANADRQFIWGLRYVDDLVLRDRNADSNVNTGNYGKSGSGLEERLYCLQDANWNVTALANASGTIQERYAYTAYGTPIFLTSAFASRSSSNYDWETLYCGYRYDTLVGLYRIRHRTYAPGINWLSRDPIAFESGDFNLYRYMHDSPVTAVDYTGLWEVTRTGGARAKVCGDPDNTVVELSSMVRMDSAEYANWLKVEDGGQLPATAGQRLGRMRIFSVPNTFVIGVGQGWIGAMIFIATAAIRIDDAARANGLSTRMYMQEVTPASNTLLNAFKDPDVWGYAFLGHGYKDIRDSSDPLNGSFVWATTGPFWDPTYDAITAGNLSSVRKHKYGLAINWHCYSCRMNWTKNVSVWGLFYCNPGPLFAPFGPAGVGYLGTWRQLMDDAVKGL